MCVLLALSLSACDPGGFRFEYAPELLENAVGVELIDYKNDDQLHFQSWAPDHSRDLKRFDVQNVTVLKTLEAKKLSDFLSALARAEILENYFAYDSPRGECIRFNYENGDFLILWCEAERYSGYIGTFTPNGEAKRFVGCFSSYYSYEALQKMIDG